MGQVKFKVFRVGQGIQSHSRYNIIILLLTLLLKKI